MIKSSSVSYVSLMAKLVCFPVAFSDNWIGRLYDVCGGNYCLAVLFKYYYIKQKDRRLKGICIFSMNYFILFFFYYFVIQYEKFVVENDSENMKFLL